ELHGVTRPVVLDVTLNKAAPHPMMNNTPTIGFDASTTIKRSEFGIDKYVPMVSDEIELRITTEASAKAPEAKQGHDRRKARERARPRAHGLAGQPAPALVRALPRPGGEGRR